MEGCPSLPDGVWRGQRVIDVKMPIKLDKDVQIADVRFADQGREYGLRSLENLWIHPPLRMASFLSSRSASSLALSVVSC